MKARIRSIIAEKRAEFRDIFEACVDLLKWGKDGALSAHRRIEAFIGRMLEKPDPARFATKPPTFWREQKKSGKQELPKQPEAKGTKIYDEKGNAHAVALDFELFEKSAENAAYFEAQVLWSDVAANARDGETEITEADWWQMQHYSNKQRLSNLTLAKEIKKHWLLGKTSAQIAGDTTFSLDTVKKYVACFARAERHSPRR